MDMRPRHFTALLALLVLALPAVLADGDHGDFSEALGIIESQQACGELTEEQFELLGDYYMELMHPGEQHEVMDKMMGGEGSKSLRLMHIRMGQRFYCGDSFGAGGMMGGMMGPGFGMMGGRGMMGSGWSLWSVLYTLFWVALIVILILLAALLFKKLTKK